VITRWGPQWSSYAVSPDGKGFVVIDQSKRPMSRELVVVENWVEELKAKVPIKRWRGDRR
jgi:hypothetical protein